MAGVFDVRGFGFHFDYGTEGIVQFQREVVADFAALQSHMTQVGSSVVIALDDGSSIEIQRANLALFAADDFQFVQLHTVPAQADPPDRLNSWANRVTSPM